MNEEKKIEKYRAYAVIDYSMPIPISDCGRVKSVNQDFSEVIINKPWAIFSKKKDAKKCLKDSGYEPYGVGVEEVEIIILK